MKDNTGYFWSSSSLGHRNNAYHPENPKRAELLDPLQIKINSKNLKKIEYSQIDSQSWIQRVHCHKYIDKVQNGFENKLGSLDGGAIGKTKLHQDTFKVSTDAVRGGLELVRQVFSKQIRNGFAAIRPPGHHACRDVGKGFCYFNNVAILAKYAQIEYGIKNVLIIDWDVHPADGTMNIFYEDPTVYILNLFQRGVYGVAFEQSDSGRGDGLGTKFNYPLTATISNKSYVNQFESYLNRACMISKPELIIISAGFDMHRLDPLADMKIETETFSYLTELVKQAADAYCDGRVVSVLEGGYLPEVLQDCVKVHVETLCKK